MKGRNYTMDIANILKDGREHTTSELARCYYRFSSAVFLLRRYGANIVTVKDEAKNTCKYQLIGEMPEVFKSPEKTFFQKILSLF